MSSCDSFFILICTPCQSALPSLPSRRVFYTFLVEWSQVKPVPPHHTMSEEVLAKSTKIGSIDSGAEPVDPSQAVASVDNVTPGSKKMRQKPFKSQ